MRRWKRISAVVVVAGIAILAWTFTARPTLSEAEELELEANRDVQSIRLIKNKRVRSSPRLMIELITLRTNDPIGFYSDRIDARLRRLNELGVLERRNFQIVDTNGNPIKVRVMQMFASNDVLWQVTGPRTNGVFEVLARPKAMAPWIKLEQEHAPHGARKP